VNRAHGPGVLVVHGAQVGSECGVGVLGDSLDGGGVRELAKLAFVGFGMLRSANLLVKGVSGGLARENNNAPAGLPQSLYNRSQP
jgi:hypothetical protein